MYENASYCLYLPSAAWLNVIDECSKLTDLSVYFYLLGFKNLQTSYKHQGTLPDESHFSRLLFCENASSVTLQSSSTGHKMLCLVCETV